MESLTRLLRNRVAVVTGAASGIGLAISRKMAEEGARVVLSDVNSGAADKAASDIRANHRTAKSFSADVTSESDIKNLVDFAVEEFQRIEILVNNAGIQYIAPIEDFPVEKFNEMIKLMLVGPFIAIKYAFPLMKKQKYGRVINVASINGLIGFAGKSAYTAAKHGLIGLTKVAALEGAAFGISVNALCPGYVDTPLVRNQLQELARMRQVPQTEVLESVIYPLVPQRRLLDASEVADYAVFLASDKGRGITGQAVVIDGGYVAQ